MSFREHDKKTFIADAARDFAARRISKREFLRRTAMAGVGFSAFAAGLLGNTRPFRGNLNLFGNEALADAPEETTKWLKDVGSKFKGTKIRYTSEATPPTVVSALPSNGATDVAVDAAISATFSEPLYSLSISDASFTLRPGTLPKRWRS